MILLLPGLLAIECSISLNPLELVVTLPSDFSELGLSIFQLPALLRSCLTSRHRQCRKVHKWIIIWRLPLTTRKNGGIPSRRGACEKDFGRYLQPHCCFIWIPGQTEDDEEPIGSGDLRRRSIVISPRCSVAKLNPYRQMPTVAPSEAREFWCRISSQIPSRDWQTQMSCRYFYSFRKTPSHFFLKVLSPAERASSIRTISDSMCLVIEKARRVFMPVDKVFSFARSKPCSSAHSMISCKFFLVFFRFQTAYRTVQENIFLNAELIQHSYAQARQKGYFSSHTNLSTACRIQACYNLQQAAFPAPLLPIRPTFSPLMISILISFKAAKLCESALLPTNFPFNNR